MNAFKELKAASAGFAIASVTLAAPFAAWSAPAGSLQFVIGDVRIAPQGGAARPAQRGEVINEGDRIVTGISGTAQMRMVDNAFIAVRPDTELQVSAYAYSGRADGQENAVLSLLKGTMRAFTGAISSVRKDRFKMLTPTATVGIRGSGNVLHFSPDLGTINHTIEGAHSVQGLDSQGNPTGQSFVSQPGVTVQVPPGGTPRQIATPQIIQNAIAPRPTAQGGTPGGTQQQTAGGTGSQQGTGGTQGSGGSTTGSTLRASAVVDTALATATERLLGSGTTGGTAGTGGSTTGGAGGTSTGGNTFTGSGANGTDLNFSNQIQRFPSGQLGTLTATPAQLAAQYAASALSAVNSLNSLAAANGSIAGITLPGAQALAAPSISGANIGDSSAQTLDVSVNVATATSILNAATTAAATSATQAAAANTAYTANGSFADAHYAAQAIMTVVNANNIVQTNKSLLQSALTGIPGGVQTYANQLSLDKAASASAAASMNGYVATSNAMLNALNGTLTMLNSAGASAGASSSATVNSLLAVAQTATTDAQTAATQALAFESAGDITQAQAQATIAQQKAAIAANALSAASNIVAGINATGSAQSKASDVNTAANAAQANATAAVNATPAPASTPNSPANLVQTNATTVATNVPFAAYSNPAFTANSGQFAHIVLAPKPVVGGVENLFATNGSSVPGDNYVLDGNKSLIEIRNSPQVFDRGANYTGTSESLAGRYIKFAGGTIQDAFRAPDNSVYLGRWVGGSMDLYSDTGASGGTSLLESIPLGGLSAHYLVNANAPLNYVRTLTGTTSYALVGSTRPTDAFGNVGTLNSASLTANFSAQTVNAGINLAFSGARTMTLDASASNMPMRLDSVAGASGAFQASSATVNCSGAACGSGYLASFNGAFGGNTAGGAGLVYQLYPIQASPPPGTARTDLITGVAAFSASAPFVGTAIPAANSGAFRALGIYPVSVTGATSNYTYIAANGPFSSNTATVPAANILLDASGRVTRISGEEWGAYNAGVNVNCNANAPCLGSTPGALASPSVLSMGGGSVPGQGTTFTANGDFVSSGASESYNSGTGVRFGRYQGGVVHAMETVSGASLVTSLGGNSVLWIAYEVPSSLALSGAYHYNAKFGTAPTDSLGNVGTLYGAQISANFANQTVDLGLRLGIAGNYLRAYAPGVALQTGGFFDASSSNGSLRVSCFGGGCAPYPVGTTSIANLNSGFGGRIQGSLANGGNDAFFRYTLNTFYDPTVAAGSTGGIPLSVPAGTIVNNYITGAVGFGSPLAITPASSTRAQTAYAFMNASSLNTTSDDFDTLGGGTITFNGGKFTAGTSGPNFGGESLTVGGTTAAATGPIAVGNGTGITMGAYQGNNFYGAGGQALTVSGDDFTGTFSNRPVLGGFTWASGPSPWPIFVSHVLSGTATYGGFVASPPGDLGGNSYAVAGSVTPSTATVNASLSANFTNQSVSTSINLTLPPNPSNGGTQNRVWSAVANNVALQDDGAFIANGNAAALTRQNATITLNTTGFGYGTIKGSLTGALLNGAMLTYILGANDPQNAFKQEGVGGAIGFHSPTFNIVQQTASTVPSSQIDTLAPFQVLLRARGPIAGFDASGLMGSVVNSTSHPAASLEDDYLTRNTISAVDPSRTNINTQNQLVKFDAQGVMVSNPCSPSGTCFSTNEIPVSIAVNSPSASTVKDVGFDPVTGIRWGRYDAAATFNFTDRVTGGALNANTTLNGINHYLVGGTQTGAPTLPASGSFSYTLVGNTSPTDQSGTAGTLNSASFSANFSAQTVSAAVNATVGAVNWSASASNVPILAGVGFEAGKSLGGTGPLSVSCSGGACNPAATAGRITGAFFGNTGQGAGFAYSLFSGSVVPGTSVTGVSAGGVAAFKR